MYPSLDIASIGLSIPLHAVLLAVSVAVGFWLGPRWIEALEGIDAGVARRAFVWIAIAVLAGGRLHFVASNWSLFADRPLTVLQFWVGLHAGGAIIAAMIAVPLVARAYALPVRRFADGMAPVFGICIAIARLGCLLQGCCFGSVCHWPWCITFPRGGYIYQYHSAFGMIPPGSPRTASVHPLQLYFAAAGLLLTAVALFVHRRKRYDGQVALVVVLLFGVTAAALEFFRADSYPRVYWGPLPQLEWIALAITVVAGGILLVAERARHDAAVSVRIAQPR